MSSDVRYGPIRGFLAEPCRGTGGRGGTPPACSARLAVNWVAQAPTPSSDTSMTEVSPVVARANSAAAMPPAIVMPPMLSP